MNLGLSLLDELEYARAPMLSSASPPPILSPARKRSPQIATGQPTLQLRSPYFIRALGIAEAAAAWGPLCSALRRHSIPIFTSAESLAKVPAASVPARWSGRASDEPFQAVELTTADLFEVSCLTRESRQWRWPNEIAIERIDGLLRSVRAAAGGDTPVGLGVPLGCHPSDLQRCISADIDFISLSCAATTAGAADTRSRHVAASRAANAACDSDDFSATELHSIVLCRQIAQQLSRPQLPMLVSAPVMTIEQAHKLLALGASAVSIDHIVHQSLLLDRPPRSPQESAGELRFQLPSLAQSVAPGAKAELPQLESQLKHARQTLIERLQSVGASGLEDFTERCLVSVSQRAQQVTGVRRLECKHPRIGFLRSA